MNSPDIVTSKHLPTRHDRTICNFSIELPKVGHTDFDILVQIIQDSALQYRQRKKDPWHQLTLPSVLLLRWRPSHPKKAVACHVWVSPLSQKDFSWFLGKSFGFFWHIIPKMGDLLCQADVRSDLDDPVLRAYLAVYKSCLGQRFYASDKRLILEEEPHYPGMGSDNIDIVARSLLGQCANAAMMSMLPLEEICTIDWFMHLVCPAWEKPPLFKWWRTTQMLL